MRTYLTICVMTTFSSSSICTTKVTSDRFFFNLPQIKITSDRFFFKLAQRQRTSDRFFLEVPHQPKGMQAKMEPSKTLLLFGDQEVTQIESEQGKNYQ
jgi:hypothetical protein